MESESYIFASVKTIAHEQYEISWPNQSFSIKLNFVSINGSKSSAIPLKPRWCVGDWSIYYFNLCFCSWKIPSSSYLIPNDETMTWNSSFFFQIRDDFSIKKPFIRAKHSINYYMRNCDIRRKICFFYFKNHLLLCLNLKSLECFQ